MSDVLTDVWSLLVYNVCRDPAHPPLFIDTLMAEAQIVIFIVI